PSARASPAVVAARAGRRDQRGPARLVSHSPPIPAAVTSGAVLLTRNPATPAAAKAARERHDQARSTRARTTAGTRATNASGVYCFSQVWLSPAAEAAPASPQHSPYSQAHDARPPGPPPTRRPSHQAARAHAAAKASGSSRDGSGPPHRGP